MLNKGVKFRRPPDTTTYCNDNYNVVFLADTMHYHCDINYDYFAVEIKLTSSVANVIRNYLPLIVPAALIK